MIRVFRFETDMCVWIGRVTGDVGIENDEPSGGRGAVKVKHPPRMRAASGPSRRATSEWERTRLCLWAPPQPHRPNCSSPFSGITAQMQRAPRRNPPALRFRPPPVLLWTARAHVPKHRLVACRGEGSIGGSKRRAFAAAERWAVGEWTSSSQTLLHTGCR
jgi:hypothetical protein